MSQKHITLAGLFVLLIAVSCRQENTVSTRTPGVFRINLDNMPRMLVFQLDEELWAAYDVQFARLYKTWIGGINFNGPMYDDRHNVQPSTRGISYDSDSRQISPWRLKISNDLKPVSPEYLGYRIQDGTSIISYRIRTPEGHIILLNEKPHFSKTNDGTPVFTRTFVTSGVPEGTQLYLSFQAGALIDSNDIVIERGAARLVSAATTTNEWGQNLVTAGELQLESNGQTTLSIKYDKRIPAYYTSLSRKKQVPVAHSDTSSLAASRAVDGKRLMALSDCAACHQQKTKAIGPSLEMIAAKYEATEENIARLAKKIIEGGTGVWGRQAMTPHPQLSLADAESMTRYVLSLDSSSRKKLRRGLAANFYKPSVQLSAIPDFIPGQKPNLSAVVDDIEFVGVDMSINKETNDFFDFDDQFVMYLSGYMNVQQPGKYQFRIKANAGAKFFLNGEKIADVNYSNYDYQEAEVTASLNKGSNKIRVEYYEDIYSSNLSIRWRKPGEEKYKRIPEEVFSYDEADIIPAAPGTKEVYEVGAPGFGRVVDGVHPSFDVTSIRPEGFNKRLSDLEFLPDGSLAVSTWDSSGSIYILENVLSGDRRRIKSRLFATGLYEVMGLEYVDGKLYALQKWELTELNDNDGDGTADEYKVALDDWTASANFHEWAFGLIYRDNFFYFNTGIGLGGNGIITDTGIKQFPRMQTKDRGKTLKVSKQDWSFEAIAHGYKAPNGIGFGVDGEIFSTDNEGHMVPTNKLMHVPDSGYPFFGNDEVLKELSLPVPTIKPPVIWMPTAEVSNSPSQPVVFKMGPFQQGQMVFGDVHHGGLQRVFVEKVNGNYQGAIFRFTQGLEAGINRLVAGRDGNLYMAGLGAGGDFGHHGQCCGLQRLSYNGKPSFDILSVSARSNGMEIIFTEPLRPGDGIYRDDYTVQQFWYETGDDVPEGGVKNDIENLEVRSVNMSADRKKIFLEIIGMKKENVVYIKVNKPFLSASGNRLWAGEAWYTLNNIPESAGVPGRTDNRKDNYLLPEEIAAGWKLLFNGKDLEMWKAGSNKENAHWKVKNGVISAKGIHSILISGTAYKNFEFEFEWKADNGADAGLYYHIPADTSPDELGYAAPEMQLNDAEKAKQNTRDITLLPGSVAGLQPARYNLYKPGYFNHARLVVNDTKVEHWLNGVRVASYDTGTDEWKRKWRGKYGREYVNSGNGHLAILIQHGAMQFKNARVREIN